MFSNAQVRKVRNKAAGRVGDALLRYDRVTGTYRDANDDAQQDFGY